ncbi:MAG: NADH-quinone oxidoreductase subunit N [Isosphaeraceae bacterium]
MPANPSLFNPRDFYTLAPEVFLAFWGLVVLLADLGVYRALPSAERRKRVGGVALAGAVLGLLVSALPIMTRVNAYNLQGWLNLAGIDYVTYPDPYLFHGALASDLMTESFRILIVGLFALVIWISPTWSFTEEWGEYFALLFWATVGMMLLTASEELLTLFLTLETMTICLYLATAFEKSKRRSAEGALKYFVYGSVSSAIFLFGLSLIYGLTGSTQLHAIRTALMPTGGGTAGLSGNVAGATAVLLMLVGFGFKVAAVPFHQWAPDAYEGAPAPVTAWIATGSKIASFVALMKVLLYALGPWSNGNSSVASPGWIGVVAVLSAASMTYGNFAALAQKNLKRMLAYSSIAHAGYMLVGVAAAGLSVKREESSGSVLFYLVAYAFANVGAFAVAAWLARDKGSEQIEDLNGMASRYPGMATCTLLLMVSLIGIPPLAGFMGKLYMFMEALDESPYMAGRLTLLWLVALGLFNSVVSAFYYVRVLRAMYLRPESGTPLKEPPASVVGTVILATAVSVTLGIFPEPAVNWMKGIAVPMLTESGAIGRSGASLTTPPGPPPAVDIKGGPLSFPSPTSRGGAATPPTPPPAVATPPAPQPAPAATKTAAPAAKK